MTTAGIQQHTHQLSVERRSSQVVENLTSKDEAVGQDTAAGSELTTDHIGAARSVLEVTTAGIQQHTHQLSVERRSSQVVENLTSNDEAVGQDTAAGSELTTDHIGAARSVLEVTTAGIQQHTHQLSVERRSSQVVENSTSKDEAVGQDTAAGSELTTDHIGAPRSVLEVTTAGMQQHTHQLSVERRSSQMVENVTSNDEAAGQDTAAGSELTTDHIGAARSVLEVTTAGMQQHTHQLSVERRSSQVVENSTSKDEAAGQDTAAGSELTTDHIGARRSVLEVTTAGIQQHTHQLSVERRSSQVVENVTSKDEAAGQDTAAGSELTTDHIGAARRVLEVTTAGIQQHTHQLSVERRSSQVVENLTSKDEAVGQDAAAGSELTTDHIGGARRVLEVTTAGIQQHTHQLSVERRSSQVVENSTSKDEAVGQDTAAGSELTTDHIGARSVLEVTTAGIQQHTHQLSVERRSSQVVENVNQQR